MTKKIIILIVLVILIVFGWFLIKQANAPEYFISGSEDGGYTGEAFCELISPTDYAITNNAITINTEGPFEIKIYSMLNTFSPNEFPAVDLNLHIRFEDKKVGYADVLYIGDDSNLYKCHGGK